MGAYSKRMCMLFISKQCKITLKVLNKVLCRKCLPYSRNVIDKRWTVFCLGVWYNKAQLHVVLTIIFISP